MHASSRSRHAHGINASDLDDFHHLFREEQGFADRLADNVAGVGGSWAFIIGFSIFLLAWAALNTVILAKHAFDPYPFIFLNLMLSMVAALQAPIIMMSQKRQGKKDRIEARIDAETNAHAAGEIAVMQDKIDLLVEILIADKDVRERSLALIQRSRIN